MDLYFERHDGEAATIEQFVQCFADASGKDFTQFMRWYSQAGTPEVTANGHYDAATKTYRLDLAQTLAPTPGQKTKEPMVIPLALGLVGRDGRDLPLKIKAGGGVEHGVAILSSPTADDRIRGRSGTAGPVDQSRIFRADQARRQSVRGRPAASRGARFRSVQPLAGAADLCAADPDHECRRHPRRQEHQQR